MKIVLINNLFKPYARGGAERVVETIADGLTEQGHEVIVVSTRLFQVTIRQLADKYEKYFFYPWNIISYFNLHKLPKILRLPWQLINIFNIQSYFKIKKILRREKPELVMTHNLMGVGFLTPLAIKKLNIKHIHVLHDIQLIHPSGLIIKGGENITESFFARVYQNINKKLFGSPNAVISPSRWLLGQYAQKGFFKNSKKIIINNPIPSIPHGIATSSSRVPSRGLGTRYGTPPRNDNKDKFIFLYVGQVEKHKGAEIMVDSFKQLKNENAELWIVGSGSEISSIKYQISNTQNIKLLGKKTPNEVHEIMKKAHCLVVPSLCYENSPTVIFEARQNNLPVIASSIGGIPEMLDKQFLFKAGDEGSLKNKMQWVIDNYGKMQVEKPVNFSVNEYIEKILEL
ncbi:MAG: glycosyltransferase [bacterium]|nr:glycosyltransferase [bacterium]